MRIKLCMVCLLSLSMRTLPVGAAFAGIGAVGAVGAIALGIVLHRDPLTAGRMLALTLIVGGIVLARFTNPG